MNKQNNWLVGSLVAIVLIVAVVLWSNSINTGQSTSEGTIKIGAIYALTGPAAQFGQMSIQGVKDAVAYFTETTGKKVELIAEDSMGDPKTGTIAATKLFTVDKIKIAVVGMSGVSAAISPIAEKEKSLLISDAALLGLTKDKHYTLQNFMPSLSDIAKQVNNNTAWKKVSVVYINDEFGNLWGKNIKNNLNTDKTVQDVSFEKTTADYRTGALKIKQFNPDVMVVVGYGSALNQVFADLTVNQITTPIISYLACTLPGVLTDKKFSLEGQYSYEYPPISNKTINDWIIKNGRSVNTFYIGAFENTLLALTAARKTGSNPDNMISYLKRNTTPGLWGDVKFDNTGMVNRDLVLTKIANGVCVPVIK
ncbi:MAG: ABC transporter substrate-binding protein [Patescibacteria group bacterium]|jgi:branched-chain amino acid transport system substrate-binding protein